MRNFLCLSLIGLLTVSVLVLTGCEAGLSQNDSSGEDAGFSFSDIYASMNQLKQEVAEQKKTIAELSEQITGSSKNLVPVGTIMPFAGLKKDIPNGWVACDGQEFTVDGDMKILFGIIGYAWGGNGSTTFRVPDLRGMFLRGMDDAAVKDPDAASRTSYSGSVVGDIVGSYQSCSTMMPRTPFSTNSDSGNHRHQLPTFNGLSGSHEIGNGYHGMDFLPAEYSDYAGIHSHTIGGGDNETRPVNASVYWIIKS
ncbi:MAG: tail fiber protein [bacterium]|nr:tail fiber protein [bacterium]